MANKKTMLAALSMVMAIGDAIKELGSVPNGVLYANICGHIPYGAYMQSIAILEQSGVITQKNNVLTWVGVTSKYDASMENFARPESQLDH
jgi:hypothetical protein